MEIAFILFMKKFLLFILFISLTAETQQVCKKVLMEETDSLVYNFAQSELQRAFNNWPLDLVAIQGIKTKEIPVVGKVLHLTWDDYAKARFPYDKFLELLSLRKQSL